MNTYLILNESGYHIATSDGNFIAVDANTGNIMIYDINNKIVCILNKNYSVILESTE